MFSLVALDLCFLSWPLTYVFSRGRLPMFSLVAFDLCFLSWPLTYVSPRSVTFIKRMTCLASLDTDNKDDSIAITGTYICFSIT